MTSDADEPIALLTTDDLYRSAELALVLEARGFTVRQERMGQSGVLRVPAAQYAAARAELELYSRENAVARPAPVPPQRGSGWPGVVIYVAVLVAIVPLVADYHFGRDWVAAGRIDSRAIAAGEWWRAATALTLHADAAHLLGNAGFGAFFGYSLARSIGGGFAWLLILATGMIGNLANAWLAGPDHRALGASTAVFAALGILTGLSWRTGYGQWPGWRQRIAPLVAGIGLLAFTGTAGENTDIGAHLTGFAAGFGSGTAVAMIGFPRSPRVQLCCGLAAIATVAIAWILALAP